MRPDPGEPTTGAPRVPIDLLEAEILAALMTGRRVLEIGTGLGVATRAMAETAAEVHTVDIDPWVHEEIWPALPPNVRCSAGLPAGEFDAAFIDGDHSTDAVRRDVITARSMLTAGGVIVAHDVLVQHVWAGLEGSGWRTIHTKYGLGVLWC